MRLKVISCAVLERELQLCASRSKNEIDVLLLEQGLHNTPEELRRRVQEAIEQADEQGFDAVILGYGLCCRGTIGLQSNKSRLVIPRGHDCITILLGSKEKYREYFDSHPGIYWYSSGWIKHNDQPSLSRYEKVLAEYTAKYGEDNAKYLMETEQNWVSTYKLATYVDWGWPEAVQEKEFTKRCAEEMGWDYLYNTKRDICDFDYIIMDKLSREQALAEYNMLIANELLKKWFSIGQSKAYQLSGEYFKQIPALVSA